MNRGPQFSPGQSNERGQIDRVVGLVRVDASFLVADDRLEVTEHVSPEEAKIEQVEIGQHVQIPVELGDVAPADEMGEIKRRSETRQDTSVTRGGWRGARSTQSLGRHCDWEPHQQPDSS